MRAVRVTTPMRVDGRLDEAIYLAVQPASDFIQMEPNGGQLATETTEVWVSISSCVKPSKGNGVARLFQPCQKVFVTVFGRDLNAERIDRMFECAQAVASMLTTVSSRRCA